MNPLPRCRTMKDLFLGLLGTAQKTRSSGGNETRLLTLGGVSGDRGRLTDMLVVTL